MSFHFCKEMNKVNTNMSCFIHTGEYTIFAPTNAAFSKLPQSVLDGLQRDTTALANILKYHVVKGSIHKADASNELQLETLAGTKIRFNIYNHNNVSVPISCLRTDLDDFSLIRLMEIEVR